MLLNVTNNSDNSFYPEIHFYSICSIKILTK